MKSRPLHLHHEDHDFFALVVLLVVPVVTILGSLFYFSTQEVVEPTQATNYQETVIPTPTPNPWKTYQDKDFGFDITYPSKGVVMQEEKLEVGECGNAIVTDDAQYDLIVDNFYGIRIINWKKTIEDYIKQQGAAGKYQTQLLENTGADEAILLENLKPNVEYARGLPPLAYVKAIYKKGDKIFIMKTFQDPKNFGGCVLPETVDPVKYSDIANHSWSIATSINFD